MEMHDILGQELAKRAIEIALAGQHSILFIGPGGNGKYTLACAMEKLALKISNQKFTVHKMKNIHTKTLEENQNVYFPLPEDKILAGTSLPCDCGKCGDPIMQCLCSSIKKERFINKLSPLLDNIPIRVEVPRLPFEKLSMDGRAPEDASVILKRIETAQQIQIDSQDGVLNGVLDQVKMLRSPRFEKPKEAYALLKRALDIVGFSVNEYLQILRVSRTIADLAGHTKLELQDIAEAIQYKFTIKES